VPPASLGSRPGGATSSEPPDRCQVAGFYLGENSNWIYMIQRACPGYVPVLLDVRRESVQEMLVFQKPFTCPTALHREPASLVQRDEEAQAGGARRSDTHSRRPSISARSV
jgi:hypothetical protein